MAGSAAAQPGLIVANFGAALALEDGAGSLHRCVPRRGLGLVVCGDRVRWQPQDRGDGVVVAREPRRTVLARAARRGTAKPLAANFERLLIVAAPRPLAQPLLLDRYLVLAARSGAEPLLIFHKSDLGEHGQRDFQELLSGYAQLGYAWCSTSVRHGEGLQPLVAALGTQTGILVGPSGVGKSSIVAALVPELEVRIGELSRASGLGRHTTTVARLYHLPGGGALIDSPGIRDFPLSDFDHDDIRRGFPEFARLAQRCRFADCTHLNEPGCAVREAVGSEVLPRRWASYEAMIGGRNSEDK